MNKHRVTMHEQFCVIEKNEECTMNDLEVGDIAIALDGSYAGHTIMRIWAEPGDLKFVSLNRPSDTWSTVPSWTVKKLPRGSRIILTVGEAT
jgi:hypothetical protein